MPAGRAGTAVPVGGVTQWVTEHLKVGQGHAVLK